MSRRPVVRPQAERDVDRLTGYFRRKASVRVALRFQQRLDETIANLLRLPEAGAAYESRNPALLGIRAWPVCRFRKYVVYYRITDSFVEIVRVLHGARNVEKLLRKSV